MRALIIVDLQNDFLPGGSLAVSNGHQVIPIANRLAKYKNRLFDIVVATQDWHPKEHGSFASNNEGLSIGDLGTLGGLDQVMWPDHCVQGTHGAEFSPEFDLSPVDEIFRKGTDPGIDSYSAFFDNAHRKSTGLGDYLKRKGVDEVVILGLATDYCVKYSALDALHLGFKTTIVVDGSRAVNLRPEDEANSVEEMKTAGARVTTSAELLREVERWPTKDGGAHDLHT